MNFCRFYNQTMNWLEKISMDVNKLDGEIIFEECENRKNSKEVNIFLGVFFIIMSVIATIMTYILCCGVKIIYKSYKLTVSKCDK